MKNKTTIYLNRIKVLNRERFGDAFIQVYVSENVYNIGVHDCTQKATIHDKNTPNGLNKIKTMIDELQQAFVTVRMLVEKEILSERFATIKEGRDYKTYLNAIYGQSIPEFSNWVSSLAIEEAKTSKPTEKPKFKFKVTE